MSTDHKAYTCTVCKKELSSRHALDVHQLVHVKETHKLNSLKRKHSNVFQCSTCPRAYAKSASLARHQSINHNGTHKKLLCEYCQRKFNYSTSLRLHIANYHTQEKPFACQFCEKTFGISSNLKNHERIHTGRYINHIFFLGFSIKFVCVCKQARSTTSVPTAKNALQVRPNLHFIFPARMVLSSTMLVRLKSE